MTTIQNACDSMNMTAQPPPFQFLGDDYMLMIINIDDYSTLQAQKNKENLEDPHALTSSPEAELAS